MKDYHKYKCEDVILDDEFQDVVLNNSSKKLNELLKYLPGKEDEIDLATNILLELKRYGQTEPVSQGRKQEIWMEISNTNKKSIWTGRLKYCLSYAACIIMVGIIFFAFLYHQRSDTGDVLAGTEISATENVLLVLSNGERVPIDNDNGLSTITFDPDGSKYFTCNNTVSFKSSSAVSKKGGHNQLITPYGKRAHLTLSDGTQVWLNSNSRINFPTVFKGDSRNVDITGELFFDVARNREKVFQINTDLLGIKVYGTNFNVQAFKEDGHYNIVLVKGKVGLNMNVSGSDEVFLTSSQKACINKSDGQLSISNVEDTELYTAWVNGFLTFSDADIADVLNRVSKYYGINITADLPEKIDHFYGKLDLKDDVEKVLDGIALISKTKYIKQGEEYLFYD